MITNFTTAAAKSIYNGTHTENTAAAWDNGMAVTLHETLPEIITNPNTDEAAETIEALQETCYNLHCGLIETIETNQLHEDTYYNACVAIMDHLAETGEFIGDEAITAILNA